MFDRVAIAIGAGAGGTLALAGALTWGALVTTPAAREEGRKLAEAEARQAIFDQLAERGKTDADVKLLPAADLCAALGGVLQDNECR